MSNAEEQGPEAPRTGIPRDLPDQEAARRAGPGPDREEEHGAPEELPEPEEPTD